MKHLAKRALVYVLALTMCLGVLPFGAMAAEGEPAAAPQTDPNKHVLDAGELELFGEGAHKDGDTAVSADGYFTFLWSAKTKVEAKEKSFEDGYSSTVRINFSSGASITKDAIRFATSGAASVKIWWGAGDAGRQMTILDASGTAVATTEGETEKDALYISTLELEKAGTYYLGGASKKNYIFKVVVTEGAAGKAPPAAWDTVAAPEIASVAVDAEDANKVTVTVSGLVGYDGADDVTVVMRDADGWELGSKSSLAEKDEHTLEFTPSASGTYTFEVTSSRRDETDVHRGSSTASFDFTLPLTAPVLKYAVNDGKGGITVEWNAVAEATGYQLTVGKKTLDVTGTKGTVTGLTVGETADISVVAVRGESTGPAAKSQVAVSDKPEVAWVFAAFGTSTKLTNNGFEKKDDGSVRVYSINGSGKVQPSAEDGLAFYYTAIDPDTTNFVFTATANVNTWEYDNGQEGFGLLVMDQVGVSGSTAPVFSNSFMLGVTGLSIGAKRRLGVGALARTGVSEYSASVPATYSGRWIADLSGIDDNSIKNIVGNCSNQDKLDQRGASLSPALTSFKLKLEKNDEGCFVTYTDHNGVEHTAKYPDTLSQVDDYIYVGMFCARHMDVTFTDISFTTTDASGSGAGEEKEKAAEPDYSFKNPVVSNREKFELDYRSNVDGRVVITDGEGAEVYRGAVRAGEKLTVPVTLAGGANTFTAVMTPDKDALTADGLKLTSYGEQTVSVTVSFSVDARTTIYVSPEGRADAKGTADDPTTLAEAVKCPAPGAVIILMEGTYHLTSGVTVDRGINGTADKPITLKAADDAVTRPVLDWEEKGNGLRINGDWWHLYGFDSTRSTAKGVHVGGNHNVVERVNVYRNANTGLSISRINFGDAIPDWPSYNTILNCSSWLNADPGYEDADGFEAKLTVGVGNVFDGCIAAYNADDGWDLFARGDRIAPVVIRNSVAFKNGYDIVDGKEVDAGNGNGFKLGGGNIPVDQLIENSVAFANKANGFTCNSNPNVKVKNCTAYANGKGSLALYTNIAESDTAFAVHGFISYEGGSADSVKAQGAQVKADYLNDTNYLKGLPSGEKVAGDWFKSLDTDAAIKHGITRNADGTVSLGGYLELTDKAPADAGARLPGRQGQNFRDVIPSDPCFEAVSDLAEKGFINGVTLSEFKPGKHLTRAELAMILYRASGFKTPNLLLLYTDVKEGQWFTEAVRYVTAMEIAAGYGDGRFGPNDDLTLEQLALMLYRYEQNEKKGGFTGNWMFRLDVKDLADIDEWAFEALCWCVMNKVITVPADGVLSPRAPVTRAQAAVIIDAYLNLK